MSMKPIFCVNGLINLLKLLSFTILILLFNNEYSYAASQKQIKMITHLSLIIDSTGIKRSRGTTIEEFSKSNEITRRICISDKNKMVYYYPNTTNLCEKRRIEEYNIFEKKMTVQIPYLSSFGNSVIFVEPREIDWYKYITDLNCGESYVDCIRNSNGMVTEARRKIGNEIWIDLFYYEYYDN